MDRSIRCLRDFLVHLAELCRFKYNDMCSFYLWKVLFTCLNQKNKTIDWEDLVHVFGLNQWEMGDFARIKLKTDWRDSFMAPLRWNDHSGSQCSRQCHGTETVYYCFDCTKNPLYEICEECFDEAQHVDHRYTSRVVTRPEGKVCHCGDVSGYNDPNKAFQCKISSNNDRRDSAMTEASYQDCWIETISQVLDYIIDYCFACINENEIEMPSITDSVGNVEVVSKRYALILYQHECTIHIHDVVRKISRILKKDISFGTFIISQFDQDEHFTVVVESTDKESMISLKALFDAEDIPLHLVNFSSVFKKQLVSELGRWLHHFSINNPSVLSRKLSLRLAFMETYSPKILTPKSVKINVLGNFIVPHAQMNSFPWLKPWNFQSNDEEKHDSRILNIMSKYDQKIKESDTPNSACRYLPIHGSRFQYLITECLSRFSHITRLRLLEVLGTIFSVTDDSKKCLAAQYLDVYCNVLYHTVVSDSSGYKLTLMSTLSQYIFPCPAIANMIIDSEFIDRCLHFSFSIMSTDSEIVQQASLIPLNSNFKLPDIVIKNKKAVICFKDIYQAMCTNTNPEGVFANENLVKSMTECFFSFNTILPLKRETSEHVQYENFDFSSFYFFFSSILIMVDGFLRNISLILDADKRKNLVTSLLRMSIDKELGSLDKFRTENSNPCPIDTVPPNLYKGSVFNVQASIFNFKVGSDIQNFFNPMSFYIKFILQWSQCGRYEPLPQDLHDYFSFEEFFQSPSESLYMSEPALSTLVMISQIEVGFWVRNGSPIQHQLKMYTKYSMREFTYFSDFYHVQFAMCYANPHDFMVNYIIRWDLKNWAEGIPMGDYPEEQLTIAMAEQCLLTLIRLLTEIRALSVSSSVEGFEQTMKYEIIHSLCFRSSSYSSLVEAIPEHVTKHPAFDLYLSKYSDYQPPTGNFDTGTYTLKKHYRKNVDPYFIGFTSNKRYEATQLVREQMKESCGLFFNDTFVPALDVRDKIKHTQYKNLYQITSTDIFGIFVKNCLVNVTKMKLESMLSKLLHLIHLCIINNLRGFEKIFWREYHLDESDSQYYQSIGSLLYLFLACDDYSSENGKIREIFRFLKDTAPHINIDDYLREQTPSYDARILFTDISESENDEFNKRKLLAKLRRDKLMQKLAKQQKEFMDNHNVTAQDISSHGTTLDNSGFDISWTYPEDDCVFCKMPKDYDVLSYFVFIERNIVSATFSSHKNQKTVKFEPVLSTCGHCAHFGCLLSHMKSIRKSLGQITKNVRDSFGLSSINCSLCNSIVNAFIPLLKGTQNCTDYNSKSLVTRHSLALILELMNKKFSLQSGFICATKLFKNTICNLELALRDGKNKFIVKKLTSRQITSLRLLNDLIVFGLEKRMITLTKSRKDDSFFSFCVLMYSHTEIDPISDTLKTKVIEELNSTINSLVVTSYENYIPANNTESNNTDVPCKDVISQIIVTRIHSSCGRTHSDICKAEEFFRKNEEILTKLFVEQLLIFLRKTCIAIHAKYVNNERAVYPPKGSEELAIMLDYCKLPTFLTLLQDMFTSTNQSELKFEVLSSIRPKFPTASPFIDIKSIVSSFSSGPKLELNLKFRAFKEDIAICMYCGSSCGVQKSSLLHFSQIGQCTNHYYNECKFKSPYGCFLLVKSNIIYLSYGSRGSFYQTPYVNKHGETDEDYKLGTPVFFHQARYEHFVRDIVISGKIPHLINRANDKTVDVGGWESM